jgi:hypothetical protein
MEARTPTRKWQSGLASRDETLASLTYSIDSPALDQDHHTEP